MKKREKDQLIDTLAGELKQANYLYITDISDLTVANSNKLRRLCFKRNVQLRVVKNTLLRKAMERSEKDFSELYGVLKGASSVMFADSSKLPAQLIKEFRKTSPKPILKGAYILESVYLGDNMLDTLLALKSKNELIADVILALQTPAKNVIGALQSGGQILSGVLKTLSEKPE
ncbi:MAG: 50S ribosomal protein L10 [Bacteroidota bacterium]